MADPRPDLRAVFCEALDRKTPQERAEYLDQVCQGDPELRGRVEALLQAHEVASGFLQGSPGRQVATVEEPVSEGPGTVIGPYKLLEQIGEGGFGVVFLAEQLEPVRRKVALKVLKLGMDTRQVIARFEAERQALALMDHPNIARVFDGGATPSGRPYFVMELVKGVPITDFCDHNHLTPRQRLELFVQVCQAVQHAHQKGIIHRDLKPSNVLVSRHDTTPIVKVIDFGVAKALGQELTDKTLFTGLAQMIGTPLYMSPEQAGMSDLDVDTRSDIYSLGVLLYELLTGTTPFTRERFQQAAYDEICRIIREEEPPRPSTRLSESKELLPSISAQRQTEPAKLTRLVRGELDWMVMKALEKDRSRRYETANAFAMDVQRYLTDEPIAAGPPSAVYKLRKYARKHRTALLTSAAMALLLVLGTVISTWQAIRATTAQGWAEQAETLAKDRLEQVGKERDAAEKARKRAEAISSFLLRAFQSPRPVEEGPEVKVIEILDAAAEELEESFHDDPILRASLLHELGATYRRFRATRKALVLLKEADRLNQAHRPDDLETLQARADLACAYMDDGRLQQAQDLIAAVYQQCYDHPKAGPEADFTLLMGVLLGHAKYEAGDVNAGIAHLEEIRRRLIRLDADAAPVALITVNEKLAEIYYFRGQYDQAIPFYEQIMAQLRQEKSRASELSFLQVERFYLECLLFTRRIGVEEALVKAKEIVQGYQQAYGPDHFLTLDATLLVIECYRARKDLDEAVKVCRQIVETSRRTGGPDKMETLLFEGQLAFFLLETGDRDEAIQLLEELVEKILTGGSFVSLRVHHIGLLLFRSYMEDGAYERAVKLTERVLDHLRQRVPEEHPVRRAWTEYCGRSSYSAGMYSAAEAHLAEVIAVRRRQLQKPALPPDQTSQRSLLADLLAGLALAQLKLGKFTEAEAAARESLAIREKLVQEKSFAERNLWALPGTECIIGESLLGQKQYAEAEAFLLRGYQGMKEREKDIGPFGRPTLTEVLETMVRLYESWGRPEQAVEWRKQVQARKAEAKAVSPPRKP